MSEPGSVVLLGEVSTGLVQNSAALSADMAGELARLSLGEAIRTRSLPVEIARSTDTFTGIDCLLPAVGARRRRAIGTVRSTVSIIDGQLLQVASSTQVRIGDQDRRQRWSHYLAQPGTVELLGPPGAAAEAVARGFLIPATGPESLNLAGVNSRLSARIQRSDRLDHQAPFSARRTRFRWSAWVSQRDGQHAELTFGPSDLRTLQLELPYSASLEPLAEVADEFCTLLARHDWLLTTLRAKVDRLLRGRRARGGTDLNGLRELHRVVTDLAHIWMPGVGVDARLVALWDELEARSAMGAQWSLLVDRVRDTIQFALAESLIGFATHDLRRMVSNGTESGRGPR